MLHPDSLRNTDQMRDLLDAVARDLVLTDVENGLGLIALPQIYPGGDTVVVYVQSTDNEFLVHDRGAGMIAAEHLGGSATYARLAPRLAALHGVEFDGHMMFSARVTRQWLANTIIFIATASRRAVEMTAEKVSEEREQTIREDFKSRVKLIFPKKSSFDVEIAGRSSRPRTFAALVEGAHGPAVLDIVTPHHVSINGAIVKFQDIAQLEQGPRRIAVLSAEAKTDSADISLLSQWTNSVLRVDATEETYRRAA